MPSNWLKEWFPHLPNALDRAPMAGLMCAGALLLGVALAGARSSNSSENDLLASAKASGDYFAKPGDESVQKVVAFHSEELVDQIGQFNLVGDRLVFVTADKKFRFVGLENLTLQNVAKALEGKSAELPWLVSGMVTEYRGSYYLLLSRAQLK